MSADQVVTVARAQRTIQDEPVPARTIAITAEVPEWPSTGYVRAAKVFHRDEAERIHGALMASLPGGTIDALFALMAHDRASVLRVPHWWAVDPAPVTGLRLYCVQHSAVHTMELADVERAYYALGAMPELVARRGLPTRTRPCPLDVLELGLIGGDLFDFVEMCAGHREDSPEWVDPQTQAVPDDADGFQAQHAAALAIHRPVQWPGGEQGNPERAYCACCLDGDQQPVYYPCATARALGVAPDA